LGWSGKRERRKGRWPGVGLMLGGEGRDGGLRRRKLVYFITK
jgi:hypothetical protein